MSSFFSAFCKIIRINVPYDPQITKEERKTSANDKGKCRVKAQQIKERNDRTNPRSVHIGTSIFYLRNSTNIDKEMTDLGAGYGKLSCVHRSRGVIPTLFDDTSMID